MPDIFDRINPPDIFDKINPPDVRAQIAARAANPPPNRFGDPRPEPSIPWGEAIGKGLLSAASMAPPMQSDALTVAEMAQAAGTQAGMQYLANPNAAGKAQAYANAIPLVGGPISQVAGPAVAYGGSNRPPSADENAQAIEGGITLAGTMLAPKVIGKVAGKFGGEGVETPSNLQPVEPPPAVETLASKAQARGKAMIQQRLSEVNPELADRYANGQASPEEIRAVLDKGNGLAKEAPQSEPISTEPSLLEKATAPLKEVANGVAPASASPEAQSAADIIRKSKAEISNAATLERYKYRDTATIFEKAGDRSNIANISNYERTGEFSNAPQGYSEFFKRTMDDANKTLKDVYGDDRVGYVDNYVRRAFKFATAADEQRATPLLQNWMRSLSANKTPLKGRVLDMPLDDALASMRANGIRVEPATTNPEVLRQWSVENANQARVYKQAWTEAKDAGLIQFAKADAEAPRSMIPLDDRAAQVFFPAEQGMVSAGRYYADPNVARIFNNAISKGLGGSPTFRALRSINNAYNQFQLGLSAFHATGTAINAGISDLSLGVQQIMNGDVGQGAGSIGRAALPGYSFARDTYKGRAFINDLVQGDSAAAKVLSEKLNLAGGRLGVDQAYKNAAYGNMMRAWHSNQYFRALGNAPLGVVQKLASPLMEYAIPRVKLGAWMDLAEANAAKLPADATPEMRQRAYAEAWDSIDNRFGQLTHDNLFWNKTASDLAQISTRSVGWNLGTLRELGGGISDMARGQMTAKALYSLALPIYAGSIGAVFHYLHTGQMPQRAIDYFYPQNGLRDKQGNPDRVSLPTYMKDVFSYGTHPVQTIEHKASPLLSMASDLMTNRNYAGDMIRNPEDPKAQQMQQMGSYILSAWVPLSLRQMHQMRAEGANPEQAAEQIFGFVRAPGEMRKSKEQLERESERRRTRPFAPRTPEQLDRLNQ